MSKKIFRTYQKIFPTITKFSQRYKNVCPNFALIFARAPAHTPMRSLEFHTLLRRSEYFILLTAIVFNENNFECLSHNY
jgi:hypothetical protein